MPYACPKEQKAFNRKYYEGRRDDFKWRNFKNKYGVTKEIYNAQLEKQDFCCGVCAKHISEFKQMLFIDHCHTTGKFRGLLCITCNTGLGQLGDTKEGLMKAYDYLTRSESNF